MEPIYLAPVAFFVISLVFSMLGTGRAVLYTPIAYWLGLDFTTQAVPLGMLLNVVTSSSAAYTYSRAKLVDWNIALLFGATMVVFAPLGAFATIGLPKDAVITAFAVFTVGSAVLMMSGWQPKDGEGFGRRQRVGIGLTGGSVLGFLAGLIGRGGGSFVMPLLYTMGVSVKTAAATTSVVVTAVGLSSVASHLVIGTDPVFLVWALSAVAVLAGSQIGSRLMAKEFESERVRQIFGVVLLGVAGILIYQSFVS
ncbi:MAG: sulfite exporter TauE/SafE family protein [Halobacteria archaeon]|nr:sulfite exporter TauE/SafE family protein [Halobacteria archaeon]